MILVWLGCASPPVEEDQDRDGIPFPADCDDTDPAASECDAPAFLDLATGGDGICAIRGTGELVCWGDPQYGQAPPDPPSGTFRSVAAWYQSYCGIRDDFSVACWGDPATPEPDSAFRAGRIDVGYLQVCALGPGGEPSCWGSCGYGCEPPAPGPFESLDLGSTETCAVALGGGSVSCWGSSATPLPEGDWRQVGVGLDITCGVATDGRLACVGGSDRVDPSAAPSGEFVAVTAGSEIACAIRADRTATCWTADNWAGQADPPPEARFAKVAVGGNFACGLSLEGEIVCWGNNDYGQLDVPS